MAMAQIYVDKSQPGSRSLAEKKREKLITYIENIRK
jgi:hypothetical protein